MAFKKWPLADLVDHERNTLLHNIYGHQLKQPGDITKME